MPSSSKGVATADSGNGARAPRFCTGTGSGYTIAIEDPVGTIDASFFHLRGWLATDSDVADLRAIVNRRPFGLHRYPRWDVQARHPTRRTTGFSVFVHLGELVDPARVAIRVESTRGMLYESVQEATPAALEAARQDEGARRYKREWILPRLACLACGGDLDQSAVCRGCGRAHDVDGILDCLPPELRGQAELAFTGAVFSHPYDGDVERVIARAEGAGGMILDCGAGLRPTIRRHVVTTEIFPYPTTDVLAVGDRLPFQDGVFDAVLSLHVLEHVPDPFRAARELLRVLKPGGTLFAVTPMIVPEHGAPHHFYNPTRAGLARLFDRTGETARVFVPPMGHPINGVWSVLAAYRDALPEAQRGAFGALTVSELLARPIEEWIGHELATAVDQEARLRLAANLCIELVK
jgi:SAM-dependent methyltransferase